jgi:hypothetical protein
MTQTGTPGSTTAIRAGGGVDDSEEAVPGVANREKDACELFCRRATME